MTKDELAKFIDGVQYGDITEKQIQIAKDSNLVIVTGQSDDGIAFSGSIDDESGTEAYLNKDGIVPLDDNFDDMDDQVEFLKQNGVDISKNKIEGVFGDSDSEHTWTFKTEIPHATFNMEDDDDEKFCLGIVISMDDLN